ncbi:FoF1 ATP synthase subunit a [Mycoplasmatota bacterium WC44]
MKITIFKTIFAPSIYSSIIITSLLSIVIILYGLKIRKLKPTDKPKGMVMFLEIVVDFVNGFCKDNFGKYWKYYAPYILTLGLFLVFSNTSGLFGLRPPTASVSVTLSLAIITFFLIHISGILSKGVKKYVKGFMEPIAPMLPLNIIGEFAIPIALSLRLFGNIFSGMIITGLVYAVLGNLAFVATPVLHGIFDVFFGLIQAVVFVLLSTIFISGQLELEEE